MSVSVTSSEVVELYGVIDGDDQLQLMYVDSGGVLVSWPVGTESDDAWAGRTLEVIDFYQYGSLYSVYGATLGRRLGAVEAYWEPTGRGQRYTLPSSAAGNARPRLIIGAGPRVPIAPVPRVFRTWSPNGSGFPTDITPTKPMFGGTAAAKMR